MADSSLYPSSILVEVELPEGAPLPPLLLDLLASLRIVLVGWYAVPEQTSPEQAQAQFEEKARTVLAERAKDFEDRGASVDTHLVFTGDKLDTIGRISSEEDCDAVLIPGPVEHLHRLLVPIRGKQNARRIAPLVADLVQDGTTNVTVAHILEEDETAEDIHKWLLEPMEELMTERGIDAGIIELETIEADDPASRIVDLADNYDVVVLGETKPSVREILFGTIPEAIAKKAEVPLIIVRHLDDDVYVVERAVRA